VPSDPMTVLRDRLIALRDSLRLRLAEADHLDAGLLQMLAVAETALAALTCEPSPGKPDEALP
jgi:hypothetical protein